jgi:SAM-dependent methyltransferase
VVSARLQFVLRDDMYDAAFYRYLSEGASQSAAAVLPILLRLFPVGSVVDFGCGQGAWLSVWKTLGVTRVRGLDGDYVDRRALLIDREEFAPADLSRPVDLGETFDLVQSLEVAEHVPAPAAETFVDNLVRHGRRVLFSAAVPGQIGVEHVNERPYAYWRELFARRGYVMLDVVRPAVLQHKSVEWWYRYNTFLFVEESTLAALPPGALACRLDGPAAVPDVAPLWLQVLRFSTRRLSVGMSTRIASWHIQRTLKIRSKSERGGARRSPLPPGEG